MTREFYKIKPERNKETGILFWEVTKTVEEKRWFTYKVLETEVEYCISLEYALYKISVDATSSTYGILVDARTKLLNDTGSNNER